MQPWSEAKTASLSKGWVISGAGALLTLLAQSLSGTEFGVWTPLVVVLLSQAANALRLMTKKDDEPPVPPAPPQKVAVP
jgi:hypothetical protein